MVWMCEVFKLLNCRKFGKQIEQRQLILLCFEVFIGSVRVLRRS